MAIPFGAHALVKRLGNEFQVNTFDQNSQLHPSTVVGPTGDFVVVWDSSGAEDGSYTGIFAQRFSSTGAPVATEFQVNTFTTGTQRFPRVAADPSGNFVVVWASYGQDGVYYPGIFAQRFTSAGTPLGGEFQVNAYTPFTQRYPAVAVDGHGDFVVVWASNTQDGDNYGIFGRRFSSAGAPIATEFQVNTYTASYQKFPAVAAGFDDFVVVWQSILQDGSNDGLFARRFSSSGAPLAAEFQVNTYTPSFQRYASIAMDADSNFVIVWQSYDQDGSEYSVVARRFSSTGAFLGAEFQVNLYTQTGQRDPQVDMDVDGDFVVVWETGLDGSLYSVAARQFTREGVPRSREILVNTYTPANQIVPVVATDPFGNFVVAWESYFQDGSLGGVFAQRFDALPVLDADGDGSLNALTDGLLILRFLFGFTGTSVTSGATGAGCTQCDSDSIQAYFSGLGLVFDIDGNGSLGALTDGLLVLRYLFGFTGTTLTSGAVGVGCVRCDAAAIVPYLAGLAL